MVRLGAAWFGQVAHGASRWQYTFCSVLRVSVSVLWWIYLSRQAWQFDLDFLLKNEWVLIHISGQLLISHIYLTRLSDTHTAGEEPFHGDESVSRRHWHFNDPKKEYLPSWSRLAQQLSIITQKEDIYDPDCLGSDVSMLQKEFGMHIISNVSILPLLLQPAPIASFSSWRENQGLYDRLVCMISRHSQKVDSQPCVLFLGHPGRTVEKNEMRLSDENLRRLLHLVVNFDLKKKFCVWLYTVSGC